MNRQEVVTYELHGHCIIHFGSSFYSAQLDGSFTCLFWPSASLVAPFNGDKRKRRRKKKSSLKQLEVTWDKLRENNDDTKKRVGCSCEQPPGVSSITTAKIPNLPFL